MGVHYSYLQGSLEVHHPSLRIVILYSCTLTHLFHLYLKQEGLGSGYFPSMGTYSGYYSSDFIRYAPVGVSYSVPMSTAVRSMVPVKSYYGGYRAYGYNGHNAGLPVSMHGPGCPPSCRSQCFMSGRRANYNGYYDGMGATSYAAYAPGQGAGVHPQAYGLGVSAGY